MTQRLRTLPLAACCILVLEAQDCGVPADVVIVNRGAQPVAVTIEARRGIRADPACRCPDGFIHPDLATAPTEDEDRIPVSWRPVDSIAVQYDSSALSGRQMFLRLILPPGTALRLGRVWWAGTRRMSDAPFWTVELTGAGRSERHEGGAVATEFKRVTGGFVLAFPT